LEIIQIQIFQAWKVIESNCSVHGFLEKHSWTCSHITESRRKWSQMVAVFQTHLYIHYDVCLTLCRINC